MLYGIELCFRLCGKQIKQATQQSSAQAQHRLRHQPLSDCIGMSGLFNSPTLQGPLLAVAVLAVLAVLAHQRQCRHQHHTLVRVAGLLSLVRAGAVGHIGWCVVVLKK